jgi:hypothetical protein
MLGRMDVQTASGPALPLGIAVAVGVLALALAAALLISWRRPPRAPALPPAPPPGSYPDDDLPSFREHPPGFPGARPVPAGMTARPSAVAAGAGRNPVRALTIMALVALLLIGAAAVVAAVAAAADPGPAAGNPSPASGTAAPPPMSVPAAPTSGQPGAGDLADVALPGGSVGLAVRAAFGGVVLEQRAVGITVTYPSVTVTQTDGTTAVAHVRLPTWNCMTDRPPVDPAAAGCRAAVPEYADLPAPALRVTRLGEGLRLHGRFPTYVRPSGGEPAYTGRVYELAVTLEPGRELPDGWSAASGELSLAGRRTTSLEDDGATGLRSGG